MLYNTSEVLTQIKEDIGIKDVPLPVDDNVLTKRMISSALKEFSVRYPRIEEIVLTPDEVVDMSSRSMYGYTKYIIPEKYYRGTEIISVLGLNPGGFGSGVNMYMPNVSLGSADMLIGSIAGIKMAASLGSMMCHAPTFNFQPPDILIIYNGWIASSFRVELALMHDPSLATIPPGAFTDFIRLATLDIEEFLYNKMKRVTDLDVGVGTINLKIDNWESAGNEKRELLKEWDENQSLSLDRINYF